MACYQFSRWLNQVICVRAKRELSSSPSRGPWEWGTHWTLADTPFEVACLLIFGLRKISILRRSLPAGLLRDYQFLLMPGDVCGWKNMEGNEGNWAGITRLMADSWGKSGGNLHTSITSRFPAFIIIFRELTCSSTGSRCDRCLIANAQRQSCPGAV